MIKYKCTGCEARSCSSTPNSIEPCRVCGGKLIPELELKEIVVPTTIITTNEPKALKITVIQKAEQMLKLKMESETPKISEIQEVPKPKVRLFQRLSKQFDWLTRD